MLALFICVVAQYLGTGPRVVFVLLRSNRGCQPGFWNLNKNKDKLTIEAKDLTIKERDEQAKNTEKYVDNCTNKFTSFPGYAFDLIKCPKQIT